MTRPLRQGQLYSCLVDVLGPSTPAIEPSANTRTLPSEPQSYRRVRLLVAEDNIVNQKVAARMLEKLGCRVDGVASGHEAVDAVVYGAYNLCFMDCQRPEMDGLTATAIIRERESESGDPLPIIAMTANAMPGDRERYLASGMDGYLSKPIREKELTDIIETWGAAPDDELTPETTQPRLVAPALEEATTHPARLEATTLLALLEMADEDRGMDDPLALEEYERDIHQAVPGSHYIRLKQAGHFPMAEQPGTVNQAIRSFLDTGD